ncbi:hypothetical protein BCR41DRAFT_209366 [Lobosporangium transversale]|uniref:Crinkler effector protein N-terminal domain-containing protein n=1 Tax=Lobosporangium transversale TaxID=64571 RepID=A0A1Y2GC04_9FUNG|nr:hypothetical protein BCR41DRAFT_209366 [Lobosporangium transversale]ORZ01942.1 hypothetical protein BCR41DRAFT_209366 [Lobosporangium transversale]|eukprot:XP_021876195.1 hypothetical protein BCR41DRAFT_209366 [Lobosporangium transversale]
MGSGTTTPNGPSRRGSIEREREVEKEPTNLKIYCIVDGEAAPFSVNILSNRSVDELKQAIMAENPNTFKFVDAKDLTLKLIPGGTTKKGLETLSQELLVALDELEELSTYFPKGAAKGRIHIIVKLPPPDIGTDSQEKNGRRSTVYFTFKEDTH